jgi:hypothetical protein
MHIGTQERGIAMLATDRAESNWETAKWGGHCRTMQSHILNIFIRSFGSHEQVGLQDKLRWLSPRAKYTDLETSACR